MHAPRSEADPKIGESDDLDRYVPYLLNHVGGRIAIAFARGIQTHGISYTVWRVLRTLLHTGPIRLAPLAAKANFDLSTLSRAVTELEGKGLVARTAGADAGRRPAVTLTRAGADLVRKLLPIARETEERALSALTPGERALLIELLHKIDRTVSGPGRGRP